MSTNENRIKAFIINRNLLTTLKGTVDFLLKEPRVEVVIFDQQSTYPPLLQYYKTCGVKVVYNGSNDGPHSVWGKTLRPEFNNNHYIVADSDCDYTGVPDDWLDRMLAGFELPSLNKIGFSLRLDDLPVNTITEQVHNWEHQFWQKKVHTGWLADIDTTFALYRVHTEFTYNAIRLDTPYTIRHIPWYLEEIDMEWFYYLDNASNVFTWGMKIKKALTEK